MKGSNFPNRTRVRDRSVYDVSGHPCFSDCLQGAARLHLPVAPDCNIGCRYCRRRFDCVNESRPGVCSRVLSPGEAVQRFKWARDRMPHLAVVGIAGPGDALANFPAVQETLAAIRRIDGTIRFCLSTNGLRLAEFLPDLQALTVDYLTVTVNAVTAATGTRLYSHVEKGAVRLSGKAAFCYLRTQQRRGIQEAVQRGICCKINTVVVPGVNEQETWRIAKEAAAMGCYLHNLLPLFPAAGTAFADYPALSPTVLHTLRQECARYLRQMHHCQRCRADAAGTLGQDIFAVEGAANSL